MKFATFLITFCVCLAPALCSLEDKFGTAHAQCQKSSPPLTTNEGLRKHTLCIFKKMGFLDDAGHFQTETIKTTFSGVFSPNKINDIIQRCFVEKSTPEESAFQAQSCLQTVRP